MADLVFRKAILPGCTGDFDKDFPPSPKVAKGRKGKLKKSSEKVCKEDLGQSMSLLEGNGNSINQTKGPDINDNECLVATESDSICLTLLTHAKYSVRSTLCWKVGNISGST